jgi:hypothetical protein
MTKTWTSHDGGEKVCENCGSVYTVTYRNNPCKDSDYFNCEVCGHRVDQWNSTTYPEYCLKVRVE